MWAKTIISTPLREKWRKRITSLKFALRDRSTTQSLKCCIDGEALIFATP